MDKPGVQGCFLPHNTCKYCGAGKHNEYQHDGNCLINLPEHTLELAKWWHIGRDTKKTGSDPGVFMDLDSPEDKAYLMGYRCPQPADITAKPVKTGVGVDLTL